MKYIPVFILMLSTLNVFGQLGISGFASGMQAPKWDNDINENDKSFYFKGSMVSLDYWFRLKEKRIEFQPEISYKFLKNEYEFNSVGLHLNTNFYLLDLFNDCNCPTFTKQEDLLKKGLFVQLIAGYNWMTIESVSSTGTGESLKDRTQFVDIGIGVGLDIGLSNFLTLTPIVRYRNGFGAKWERSAEINELNEAKSALSMYEFGVRLGIRFDARKF